MTLPIPPVDSITPIDLPIDTVKPLDELTPQAKESKDDDKPNAYRKPQPLDDEKKPEQPKRNVSGGMSDLLTKTSDEAYDKVMNDMQEHGGQAALDKAFGASHKASKVMQDTPSQVLSAAKDTAVSAGSALIGMLQKKEGESISLQEDKKSPTPEPDNEVMNPLRSPK